MTCMKKTSLYMSRLERKKKNRYTIVTSYNNKEFVKLYNGIRVHYYKLFSLIFYSFKEKHTQ